MIDTINKYGFASLTKQTKKIKEILYMMTFFNKCLLLVILTANFEFTDRFFNGPFSDFNEEWFKRNGKSIVMIMITQIGITIFNSLIVVIKQWAFMAYDQNTLRPSRY